MAHGARAVRPKTSCSWISRCTWRAHTMPHFQSTHGYTTAGSATRRTVQCGHFMALLWLFAMTD